MSKILTLKARLPGEDEEFTWHDRYVLGNALQNIAKGASIEQLSKWISVATKIADAAEEAGLGDTLEGDKRKIDVELKVVLKNGEAELFWKKLVHLPLEQFGTPLRCTMRQHNQCSPRRRHFGHNA